MSKIANQSSKFSSQCKDIQSPVSSPNHWKFQQTQKWQSETLNILKLNFHYSDTHTHTHIPKNLIVSNYLLFPRGKLTYCVFPRTSITSLSGQC